MTVAGAVGARHSTGAVRQRWRPNLISVLVVVVMVLGAAVLLYPWAASWLSAYNQRALLAGYSVAVQEAVPAKGEQLELAHQYNAALSAGVRLDAGANVSVGDGSSGQPLLEYNQLLRANEEGLMGRVRIGSIGVDLPIYHGTSDQTLLRGAGHLEGSSLPVGGLGTHAVITAHRGLASATMFTNLDQVQVGDTFTVEVFGEVLVYRVFETRVVEPEDTETLLPVEGKDLVTLVTCTPLGINSHRILVTGERVTPTPQEAVAAAERPMAAAPGFPWWAVAFGVVIVGSAVFLERAGVADARRAAFSAVNPILPSAKG